MKALGLTSNPRANLKPQGELENAADSLCHRAARALRLAALRLAALRFGDFAALRPCGLTARPREIGAPSPQYSSSKILSTRFSSRGTKLFFIRRCCVVITRCVNSGRSSRVTPYSCSAFLGSSWLMSFSSSS